MLTDAATAPTPLLPATVPLTSPAPTADAAGEPHWHMPADACDHRTYACCSCCPHGDDAV